jgi:hypothetical protein
MSDLLGAVLLQIRLIATLAAAQDTSPGDRITVANALRDAFKMIEGAK